MKLKKLLFDTTSEHKASLGLLVLRITFGLTMALSLGYPSTDLYAGSRLDETRGRPIWEKRDGLVVYIRVCCPHDYRPRQVFSGCENHRKSVN